MRLAIGICAAEIVCVRRDTPLIMITPSVLHVISSHTKVVMAMSPVENVRQIQ